MTPMTTTPAKDDDLQYCYCCRVHHPRDQMRLYPTRAGHRWRCVRSIEAARLDRQSRDAFGRQQTRINHETSQRQAAWNLLQRLGKTL